MAPHKTIPVNLVESTSTAVDRLLGSLNPPLARDTTILVASFANLDELTVSTTLGRLLAEETAGHLIQLGYRVPEVRLTEGMHIRNDGEFMLSREVEELSGTRNAGIVVTGTISVVANVTYINFRLIRLSDGIALAASNLELPERFVRR